MDLSINVVIGSLLASTSEEVNYEETDDNNKHFIGATNPK